MILDPVGVLLVVVVGAFPGGVGAVEVARAVEAGDEDVDRPLPPALGAEVGEDGLQLLVGPGLVQQVLGPQHELLQGVPVYHVGRGEQMLPGEGRAGSGNQASGRQGQGQRKGQ